MDEKIRHQLKIKKVREMKNPTILMNSNDFEIFKKEIELKAQDFKIGDNPIIKYQGVPIKTSEILEKGDVIVYDDASNNCL
jgi:hypothetical protein